MSKTAAEIFSDKVNIIYEYNNESPLFVRAANAEIENNNVDRAIEILNKGIELYPSYSTAFFLLGKAYTLAGNYSNALKYIKKGSDLIHSKRTYNYYLKDIENNKKQRALFQGSTRNFFMPEREIYNDKESPAPAERVKQGDTKAEQSVDDRLEQIAREISSARIPEAEEADNKEEELLARSTGGMIVSETLAKIYTAQGELKEAIEVYKKLVRKDPSKEKYFLEKIKELKQRLEA